MSVCWRYIPISILRNLSRVSVTDALPEARTKLRAGVHRHSTAPWLLLPLLARRAGTISYPAFGTVHVVSELVSGVGLQWAEPRATRDMPRHPTEMPRACAASAPHVPFVCVQREKTST